MSRPATRGGARGIPLLAPGVAASVLASSRVLPFGLGRQARAGEARIGFRLVPATADDGLVGTEVGAPRVFRPEARRIDALAFAPFPSGIAPERLRRVSARHKGSEFVHGHRYQRHFESGGARAQARLLGGFTFGRVAAPPELSVRDVQPGARSRIVLAQLPSRCEPRLERCAGVLQLGGDESHATGNTRGRPRAQGALRLLQRTIPTGRVEGRPT